VDSAAATYVACSVSTTVTARTLASRPVNICTRVQAQLLTRNTTIV